MCVCVCVIYASPINMLKSEKNPPNNNSQLTIELGVQVEAALKRAAEVRGARGLPNHSSESFY